MEFDGEFDEDFAGEDYGATLMEDATGAGVDLDAGTTLQEFAGEVTLANTTAGPLETADFVLPPVRVVNCVVAFHCGCPLDLRTLTISTRIIEYNPRRLNAAIARFDSPRLSATIFPSGRVTIAGRATFAEIKKTAKLVAKIIQKANHPDVTFCDFRINTLICTANCGFPVRLENLAADHSLYCSYEPEVFCGVIYRFNPRPELKATALIFVSGRMVISGCKAPSEANEVYRNLYAVLYQYRC